MLTIVIVVIFLLGLILFIGNLPTLKKAAKEGWESGSKHKKA